MERFRVHGRFTGLAIAIVAAIAACVFVSCGTGEGPVTGDVRPLSVSLPPVVTAGTDITVAFDLTSSVPRSEVVTGLELVPFDPAAQDLLEIDPNAVGYQAIEVSGYTVTDLSAGAVRRVNSLMHVGLEVPAGLYAAVLRVNKRIPSSEDHLLERERPGDRLNNHAVAGHYIEVLPPPSAGGESLANLHILSWEPDGFSFELADHDQPLGFPGAPGTPDSGDLEAEPHIRATLLVGAQFTSVTAPVTAHFDLGISDGNGGMDFHPLDVIVRGDAAAGTALAGAVTFAVDAATGCSFEVPDPDTDGSGTLDGPGAIRGANVELVLTPAAVAALSALTSDTIVSLRATIDRGDAVAESSGTDNASAVDLMYIANHALAGAPMGGATPPNWYADLAEADPGVQTTGSTGGRGSQSSAVLKGNRLQWNNAYPYVLFSAPRVEEWGWRDKVAIGYLIGSTLSYDTRSAPKPQIGDGDLVHLSVGPVNYLQTPDGGGGRVGSFAPVALGWETFTLEVLNRNGDERTVRFRCHNGTNYLWRDNNAYLDASNTAAAGTALDLTLVDVNGGELLSGDKVRIQRGSERMYSAPGLLASFFKPAHPVSDTFVILKQGVTPYKAKFYADGWSNLWILDQQVQIVYAAAAAEVDIEDVPGSYHEWEVRVFGEKVFGEFTQIVSDSGGLAKKTLLDAGSKYTKSKEKKVKTKIWIGPVPIDLEVGAKGSLGIKGKVTIESNNRLAGEVGPFVRFSAFAGASLDVFFASVGVRGELTLLELTAKFKAELQLFSSGSNAKLTLKGPIELKTMGGRIYIFATWDLLFTSGRKEWDIAKWDGWTGNWDWFRPVVYQWPA